MAVSLATVIAIGVTLRRAISVSEFFSLDRELVKHNPELFSKPALGSTIPMISSENFFIYCALQYLLTVWLNSNLLSTF